MLVTFTDVPYFLSAEHSEGEVKLKVVLFVAVTLCFV
jgi:hypothetical protein